MLEDKHCEPCEDKTGILNALEIQSHLKKVKGWVLEDGNKKISKTLAMLRATAIFSGERGIFLHFSKNRASVRIFLVLP